MPWWWWAKSPGTAVCSGRSVLAHSSALRAWAVAPAGARLLTNTCTRAQLHWTHGATLSGHSSIVNAGAQLDAAHAHHWPQCDNTAPEGMVSGRNALEQPNILSFYGFLSRLMLGRFFTQGLRLARSACSKASFKKLCAWIYSICSNFMKKRFGLLIVVFIRHTLYMVN